MNLKSLKLFCGYFRFDKSITLPMTFLIALFCGANAFAIPARVLIIRHAEKPSDANDPNLSAKGALRANALTGLFKIHPEYASNGLPAAVYGAKYIPGKNSKRSVETVTPLAQSLGLQVQTPYVGSEAALLGDSILKSNAVDGKVVFIAWAHGSIPALAAALKGDCPQIWDGDQVFDRIWDIEYLNVGTKCTDLPQSLFPDDSK